MENKDVHFTAQCIGLNLFENATFIASCIDSSGEMIDAEVITLTQEQYKEWSTNDNYILNLVAKTLANRQSLPEPEILTEFKNLHEPVDLPVPESLDELEQLD